MNESQAGAARDARTAHSVLRPYTLRAWLVVGFSFGLFLGLVGALESYEYAWPLRIGFWSTLCLIAAAAAAAIETLLDRLRWHGLRDLGRWALLALALALVMTPVAYFANSMGGARPLEELPMFATNALVISATLVAIRAGLDVVFATRLNSTEPAAPDDVRPVFRQRLPLPLRDGRIRALQAEGHYVRVFTDCGSDLVLFRLKDSILELEGIDGRQVHRSWWVARDAVRAVRRHRGRTWLELDDRLQVPVSRRNVSRLKDAGWI